MTLFKAIDCPFDLNHSRQMDVHLWSDKTELNTFVDSVYKESFVGSSRKQKIAKKHLKKVLVDLYVAWMDDPDLCLGFYLKRDMYKANSRYNALSISNKTIDVVKTLSDEGWVDYVAGHFSRDGTRRSHNARMKATEKLADKFYELNLNRLDFGYSVQPCADSNIKGRETVIMREQVQDVFGLISKRDVEYQDTEETIRMRDMLNQYNDLLSKHHIDLSSTDRSYLNHKDQKLFIDQSSKFTRRIFNNNNWKHGGRFYGGFWQRIPSKYRPFIRIDGRRTVELDYSAHHPVLLYALEGINYSSEIGSDPYTLEAQSDHPIWQRHMLKDLLLLSINANSDRQTFDAVRQNLRSSYSEELRGYELTDGILSKALTALRQKHQPIAKHLATGKGIELQYIDSQMTEYILTDFMRENIPILSVHDSYITLEKYNADLRDVMNEAWRKYSGLPDNKLTEDTWGIPMPTHISPKQMGYTDELFDGEEVDGGKAHQELVRLKDSEYVSERHKTEVHQFHDWLCSKEVH
jgi:hypothetical protein